MLEGRIEVATPVTAAPRLREGVYLWRALRLSPYEGAAFHGAPLLLPLLGPLAAAGGWTPGRERGGQGGMGLQNNLRAAAGGGGGRDLLVYLNICWRGPYLKRRK